MKIRRIRKLANASTWSMMFFAAGLLAGVVVVAFLPGMPWASTIEPIGATDHQALELAAQRSAVAASWWVVAVSMASSLIGAVGVIAVLATLNQTRQSVKVAEASLAAAQTIGMAQTRAYLQVTMTYEAYDAALDELVVTFINKGQSPAKNVVANINWHLTDMTKKIRIGSVDLHKIPYLAIGETSSHTADIMNPALGAEGHSPLNGIQLALLVTVETEFEDVFGLTIRETFRLRKHWIRQPIPFDTLPNPSSGDDA